MDSKLIHETLEVLQPQPDHPYQVFVGLDGFIDEIIHVVDKRQDFDSYNRIETISDFGHRILNAAGKSTNIEFVVQQEKMGGNGPLMASGLGRLGCRLLYAGALGRNNFNPIFNPIQELGEIISIADPGHTDAFEFKDGKLMFGRLESLKDVNWNGLVSCAGGADLLEEKLSGCSLIAMTNWTMLPFCQEIYEAILNMPSLADKLYFFDLADPAKRTSADLKSVLNLLSNSTDRGRNIMLGLNHREAQQVARAIGHDNFDKSEEPGRLMDLATGIRDKTGIREIIIHPRMRAVATTADGEWCAEGPFTPNPLISTGAGDHFNAGYCFARLMGLPPRLALVAGNATSGYYVRHGLGPQKGEILRFLESWSQGNPDAA
jgi:hypothetical protein